MYVLHASLPFLLVLIYLCLTCRLDYVHPCTNTDPADSQPSHDATDEEEDDEEEDGDDGEGGRVRWGEYREQTLYEVLYRCQEVLRSRYVAALEARLQLAVAAVVGGGGGGGQWQVRTDG